MRKSTVAHVNLRLSGLVLTILGVIVSLSLSHSAGAAVPGEAAIIMKVPVMYTGVGAGGQTRGYAFYLDNERTATHLGLYDYNCQGGPSGTGLQIARQIGLWDSAGELIGSVEIPVGARSRADGLGCGGSFYWGELPEPLTLVAEEQYTLGVWYSVDPSPGLCMLASWFEIPGFHWVGTRETGPPGGEFAMPTIPRLDRPNAYMGPNIRFTLSAESFQVTSISYDPGTEQLTLTWTSQPGAFYTVEVTRELGNPLLPPPQDVTHWTSVSTDVESGGNSTTLAIDAPQPGSYYRIKKQ